MVPRTVRQAHLPTKAAFTAVGVLAVIAVAVAVGATTKTGGSTRQVQAPAGPDSSPVALQPAVSPAETLVIYVVGSALEAETFAQSLAEYEALTAAFGARLEHYSVVVVGEGGAVDHARAVGGAPSLTIQDLRAN